MISAPDFVKIPHTMNESTRPVEDPFSLHEQLLECLRSIPTNTPEDEIFVDMEVFFPVFRLMEAGWQVDVAAPKLSCGK